MKEPAKNWQFLEGYLKGFFETRGYKSSMVIESFYENHDDKLLQN